MNEMVRYHHRLSGREFEQTPGDSGGHRSLTCCNPWGHKESRHNNIQQSDSDRDILLTFLSIMVYYKILTIVPRAYPRTLLFIYFI